MKTIDVNLPDRAYTIRIDSGLLQRLGDLVHAVTAHRRALLAVDSRIADSHGARALASLRSAGWEVTVHELVAEERAKSLDTVRGMYSAMLGARLERSSPVFALGGGIVGDIAGFAAATFLRGVPIIQLPTTLLAMVDAAIGGKTGVNLPLPSGGLGKNLVGAFWQPRAVLIDPETLATLNERDFRCGLAECVKHAMIADPDLLVFLEHHAMAIEHREIEPLAALVYRSAAIKARVIEDDERESGRRMLLNLGHTFGHALESMHELDFRHGEAVAVGLHAALVVARDTQRIGAEDAERTVALLKRLGLPTMAPPVPVDRLVEVMAFDKKVSGGRVRLVLPLGLGRAEVVDDIPESTIRAAWNAVVAA